MVLGGSWAPSGRGLGLSGPSCGRSWGLLGRLLGVQIQALCEDCSNMGSKRPSGSILGPSGEGFGRFWGEFLDASCLFGGLLLTVLPSLLCQDPRAVSRSLAERPNFVYP